MPRISPAAWTAGEVEADRSWTYRLSTAESAELLAVVRAAVQTAGPADRPILCNHTMLHARTSFEDHVEEERKRTLYRLWLARPDSRRLPDSWAVFYETAEPGTVRGGMKGHHYDDVRRSFDARQAKAMGMKAT